MAAHLIQLTAISHLSSEILGLEVNVVRERLFDLAGAAGEVTGDRNLKRGHFLVYSSFAASALVAPHESLVEFWQRAFVADLIRRFAAGPTLTDPRGSLPAVDQQRVINLWQTLLAHLVSRFAALDNDRLDAILDEINEQTGAWHSFWEPVQQSMRQTLMDTGLRGAIALCDLLAPSNPATAPAETLPRQRMFQVNGKPVNEEDRARWRKVLAQQGGFKEQMQQVGDGLGELVMMAFSPRQARDRAKDMATRKARARIHQRRDAVEVALVDQIAKQVTILREALRSQINTCAVALARANQEAGRMADRIDPRIPDGHPSTSTYYDLETGAVGRDYLQHFYNRAASAVTASDWHNALAPLFSQLVKSMNALSADQIYAMLNGSTGDNVALLDHVHKMIDINHIITVQHGQEVERIRQRPDNRIHQWLDRLNPYIRWDADRFSFHESNLEHIRLAAVPTSRQEDPNLMAATVGQEDFKWVPTGDHMRMDAVWIVHGLPVTLLERLDEFRVQYDNGLDFPVQEEFHLNPDWVNLPEITPEAVDRSVSPAIVPRTDPLRRRTLP